MAIGQEVTPEMYARAERKRTDEYREARAYLSGAVDALEGVPTNDCVAEAIDEIRRVIFKLAGPAE